MTKRFNGAGREGVTAQLDSLAEQRCALPMGRLLEKLVHGTTAWDVKPEEVGFTLVGKPDFLDEFSDLVREAVNHAGDDFVVFPTKDSGGGYSQMLVVPFDDARALDS